MKIEVVYLMLKAIWEIDLFPPWTYLDNQDFGLGSMHWECEYLFTFTNIGFKIVTMSVYFDLSIQSTPIFG